MFTDYLSSLLLVRSLLSQKRGSVMVENWQSLILQNATTKANMFWWIFGHFG